MIGIPAMDGRICIETALSLAKEQRELEALGHEVAVSTTVGCSLVTHARNNIAGEFMESGAEVLVFVDSDIAWAPGAICRLIHHNVDFVAGAYRYKKEPEAYPVSYLDETLTGTNGLVEVRSAPAGFLALRRDVFVRLMAHEPRPYRFAGEPHNAWFHAPYSDGELWGEDNQFCNDWREIGGKVFIDPRLCLTHIGGLSRFEGRFADWLKQQPDLSG